MGGDSGKRGRSFLMMHAVRLLNAQLAWMRWSQKGFARSEEIEEGKQLLLRIASMLTKLITLFDSSSCVGRSRSSRRKKNSSDEEEDENENGHPAHTGALPAG